MLKYQGRQIYYEVHGEGEPLLLLNGIFMSSASWAPFVPVLSSRHQLILLDLLDQGRSSHLSEDYTQDLQVDVVCALLEHLGLTKVSVAGISYGGEVALLLALRYPSLLKKLILANTTSFTSPWLKDIGRAWEYAIASHDGRQFFKTCIPPVYSPGFYTRNIQWLREREELFVRVFTPPVYEAFLRLTRSAESFDVRGNLDSILTPTLVISAEHDYVTPVSDQEYMVRHIPGASHLLIKDSGHAAMYEKPVEFASALLGFLAVDEVLSVL